MGTVWLPDMVLGSDRSLRKDPKSELMLLLRKEPLAGEGLGDSGGRWQPSLPAATWWLSKRTTSWMPLTSWHMSTLISWVPKGGGFQLWEGESRTLGLVASGGSFGRCKHAVVHVQRRRIEWMDKSNQAHAILARATRACVCLQAPLRKILWKRT
jgi:hypothetical protein